MSLSWLTLAPAAVVLAAVVAEEFVRGWTFRDGDDEEQMAREPRIERKPGGGWVAR